MQDYFLAGAMDFRETLLVAKQTTQKENRRLWNYSSLYVKLNCCWFHLHIDSFF